MKISVIMQSFLGDYPGSRSLPKEKFLRAVNSFLAQEHSDKELVIVADGCEITKKMFELYYSGNEQIKFCYLYRDLNKEKSMYSIENNVQTFRGLPRQLGLEIATGDLVTYFDSDDIMLPHRLKDINEFWEKLPDDVIWSSNVLRLFHESALNSTSRVGEEFIVVKNMSTGADERFYINKSVYEPPPGKIVFSLASYAICHRKNVKTKWINTENKFDEQGKQISGTSEDVNFGRSLMREGQGVVQESASIIICHHVGLWDV